MALTNKQAAARIAKKLLANVEVSIHTMDAINISSVAEKKRISDDNASEVKEYAKAFLKPALDRINNILLQIDQPEEEAVATA